MRSCNYIILVAPSEIVSSGICGQWRPRSAGASAQSDQGLHCPLRMRRINLNLCILRMLEDTFSLGATNILRGMCIKIRRWNYFILF